jgi:hypothetical protein
LGAGAGIDPAKPLVDTVGASFGTVSAAFTSEAEQVRARDRAIEVAIHLGIPEDAADAYVIVQCAGYNVVRANRLWALQYRGAREGLSDLTSASPDTIIGLLAAQEEGANMTEPSATQAAQQRLQARNFYHDCAADAANADFAFPASLDAARNETALASALLGFFDVWKSVLRPVVITGLTRVDRERRMNALRAWARDTQHGLPALQQRLERAANSQEVSAGQNRLMAAGTAREAWLALTEARTALLTGDNAVEACTIRERVAPAFDVASGDVVQTGQTFLASRCVVRLRQRLSAQIGAFNAAATKYDEAFDADPTTALRSSSAAAEELQRYLAGDMTPRQAAAARAASIAAAMQWLEVLSSVEKITEDAPTRTRLQRAQADLLEALGLAGD